MVRSCGKRIASDQSGRFHSIRKDDEDFSGIASIFLYAQASSIYGACKNKKSRARRTKPRLFQGRRGNSAREK